MVIYKVFARDIKTGDMEVFSPIACNRNEADMVQLAIHIKNDMSEYYDKVTLRADEYKYVGSHFIEV